MASILKKKPAKTSKPAKSKEVLFGELEVLLKKYKVDNPRINEKIANLRKNVESKIRFLEEDKASFHMLVSSIEQDKEVIDGLLECLIVDYEVMDSLNEKMDILV